ncbi:MAG: hypothetical protein F6K14_34290 [Symploca sp. SIO2C1]|nr:hypothetical protein [Symploca sp. SIO2C1]
MTSVEDINKLFKEAKDVNSYREAIIELMKKEVGEPSALKLRKCNKKEMVVKWVNGQNSETPKESEQYRTEFENLEFVLIKDAVQIMEYCKEKRLRVSFRKAGAATLARMAKGHPCKGHDIVDKTIKEKKEGEWTYRLDVDGVRPKMESYKGLVGKPKERREKVGVPKLEKIWGVKEKGWGKVAYGLSEVDNILSIVKSRPILYTGDYDLHDLLSVKGGKLTRILSGTPEEVNALEGLVRAMDPDGQLKGGYFQRLYENPYARIRHGAQTSYISYLLTNERVGKTEMRKQLVRTLKSELGGIEKEKKGEEGLIPSEGSVVRIADEILMFTEVGNIYHLSSIEDIFRYYVLSKLETQIPYYYFLAYLKEKNEREEGMETVKLGLRQCSKHIAKILKKLYKVGTEAEGTIGDGA